jgi:membrane-associated protease RseP (regulator of RpoE activity)
VSLRPFFRLKAEATRVAESRECRKERLVASGFRQEEGSVKSRERRGSDSWLPAFQPEELTLNTETTSGHQGDQNMKRWKLAALVAALMFAAAAGAALLPVAHGQTRVLKAQSPVAVQLHTGGSRIGISIRDVEDGDAKDAKGGTGVVVEEVVTESPAGKAGMRKGDVIVEFDGERVRSVRQLTRLVQETPSGRTVQAALLREGQPTTVSITPREGNRFNGEKFDDLADLARDYRFRVAPRPPVPPAPPAAAAPLAPPVPPSAWGFDEFFGRATSSRLGITVDSLSSQLAEYFGTKDGVLVTSVTDGSAASKAGLKAGDVITSINGSSVSAPSDVRRRILDMNDGDEFTLAVMRDRKSLTLKGKAERQERRRTVRSIL